MQAIRDFLLPPAKSTLASQLDAVFWYVHITSLVISVGVLAAAIWFIYKYRRRSEDDVTPVITHNSALEVTWSVIPLILVLISFGWGFKAFQEFRTIPDDAYEVNVTAQKWTWQFSYSNGASTVGELHVPANRPVKLTMTSQDVIHSFYVPDYRIKQDVVPNRYTELWFNATETGESVVFCAEYCGTDHSNMMATVIVHEQDEFENWLASNSGGASQPSDLTLPEWGEQVSQQYACMTCHVPDGSGQAPSWNGLFGSTENLADGSTVEVDENYIRESILEPDAKIVEGYSEGLMNTYQGTLNEEQITAIIEYIKTLE